MRILVTGGAGFIGSHVVDRFIEAGHQVSVVDNLSNGKRANLNPKAKFYPIDIRGQDLRTVFEQERPEVISHHAAQIDVRYSVENPLQDADVNVLGSLRLLECAREFGVRKLIYISSGGAIYGEPEYLPCDEEHPVRPLSPYGVAKYTVEKYLDLYATTYGLDYTVLRYANVYGPRQNAEGEAGVIAIFTHRMLRDEPVTINGSGDQERDFVYVADCAAANLLALERGSRQACNLGSGQSISINVVCQLLQKLTGYTRAPQYGPAKPGETFRIYLDSRLACESLGWNPIFPFEEGLAATVRDFRAQTEPAS